MFAIWCGFIRKDIRSKRVQEKYGFKFLDMGEGLGISPFSKLRMEYVSYIKKSEWESRDMPLKNR